MQALLMCCRHCPTPRVTVYCTASYTPQPCLLYHHPTPTEPILTHVNRARHSGAVAWPPQSGVLSFDTRRASYGNLCVVARFPWVCMHGRGALACTWGSAQQARGGSASTCALVSHPGACTVCMRCVNDVGSWLGCPYKQPVGLVVVCVGLAAT